MPDTPLSKRIEREYREGDAFALVSPTDVPAIWQLDMIRVPPKQRRAGIASQLVARVCDAADAACVTLVLTIHETTDGPSEAELQRWYERSGFVGCWYRMVREPCGHLCLPPDGNLLAWGGWE